MSAIFAAMPAPPAEHVEDRDTVRRRSWWANLLAAAQMPRGAIGIVLAAIPVATAFIGPLVLPHSPTAFVTIPFAHPGGSTLLGGDVLGRDVLSRLLDGGRSLLEMALLSTCIAVGGGTIAGMSAAYLGGFWDDAIMRAVDVLLSFPQLILALLFVSVVGPKAWIIVLAVGLSQTPGVTRVIRGAALRIADREFVKAAELQGASHWKILWHEITPSVTSPLMVEAGLRFTFSMMSIAALGYLGLGQPPPTPNWGYMISENSIGVQQNPWSVVAPLVLIAALTVGINLYTDAFARVSIGINRRYREPSLCPLLDGRPVK
jgi:peptide/nickel transport system permease protein